MNKVFNIFVLSALVVQGIYANDINIDNIIQDGKEFNQVFNKHIDVINANTENKTVYDILSQYENNKAALTALWFDIALQLESDNGIAFFIQNTSIKIKSILALMVFDEDQPLTESHRKFLFEKLQFLQLRADAVSVELLSEKYIMSGDVFIRTMPVVVDMTKKKDENKCFKVIKKGTKVKLKYKTFYQQTGDKKSTRWGYVYSYDLGEEGWINLNYFKGEKVK